jgi:hypothetical protein
MNVEPRILDKIKACLNMASDTTSPEEAAIAMKQAQALMRKHGVTLAQIDRNQIGIISLQAVSVSRVKKWENNLIHMVAGAFGCKVSWTAGKSGIRFGRFNFIGVKSQLELAHYAGQVLQRKLYKARAEYLRQQDEQRYYDGEPKARRSEKSAAGDSFCVGWVMGVERSVKAMVVPEETRLLIETVYKEHIDPSLKAKVHAREVLDDDMIAGYREGADESLHRPMEAAPERLKLTNT